MVHLACVANNGFLLVAPSAAQWCLRITQFAAAERASKHAEEYLAQDEEVIEDAATGDIDLIVLRKTLAIANAQFLEDDIQDD